VANGDGLEADKGEEARLLGGALDGGRVAPDGIWPVEDNDVDPCAGGGAEGEEGRPDEGVIARAHVGEVDEEEVDGGEVLGRGR
jgi:hypothetical protein